MSNRYDELIALIPEESADLVGNLVNDVCYLENKMDDLKKMPFIEVNPKNNMQQRNTPAYKMYKELLQQYINCIKLLESVIYREKRLEDDKAEDSPLRKWFKENG